MFYIYNLSGDELSISFYTGIVMTRMNLVIQYLRFQLFREKLYRTLRMFCRCLQSVDDFSVNDSSSRCLLFFGENLADDGGLFRGEVRHANFEGTVVMYVYSHLPSSKAVFDFAFTKMQWANVCTVSLNFVPTLWIFCSHWARTFGSFGKLKKPTLFPFASTVPLWLQRGTAIDIWTRTHPQWN